MKAAAADFTNITPDGIRVWKLYEATADGAANGPGWCGYFVPRTKAPFPGETLSLKQSFGNAGSYLFALKDPNDYTKLANRVNALIRLCKHDDNDASRVVAWIRDGQDSLTVGSNCFAMTPGLRGQYLVSVATTPFGMSLAGGLRLQVGRMPRPSKAWMPLSFNSDERALRIDSVPGHWGANGFMRTASGVDVAVGGLTVAGKAPVRIPLAGPYRGCVLVEGAITWNKLFASASKSGFEHGLRYVHGSDSTKGDVGKDVAQVYPLIVPDAAQCGYTAAIDPLDPLNRSKSTVDLTSGKLRTLFAIANGVELPSYFRTAANGQLTLLPRTRVDGDSKAPEPWSGSLILESEESSDADGKTPSSESIYFSLFGDFGMAVDADQPKNADGDCDLLCGLSGTETISFLPSKQGTSSGDGVRFIPQEPAFVKAFPLKTASPVGPPVDPDAEPLDSTYVTSRVSLLRDPSAPRSNEYLAQPKGGSLYGQDGVVHTDSKAPLGQMEPRITLPKDGLVFPMVPYAGVVPGNDVDGFSADVIERFEVQVVSAVRRKAIGQKAAGNAAVKERYTATTPSGFLVTVEPDGHWSEILLGQVEAPAEQKIRFCSPDPKLQQAFQTSDLFLVTANAEHLGGLNHKKGVDCKDRVSFDNTLTIGDWVLKADVGKDCEYGKYADYRNVIIVKGCKGKLYDPPPTPDVDGEKKPPSGLVASPEKWTQRSDFSSPATKDQPTPDPDQQITLSQWLQDFFADAGAKDKSPSERGYYEHLNRIAVDPNWTGVLVLKMTIDEIPNDLAGIAAGIRDKSHFNAHHLGIEISQVELTDAGPRLNGASSIFGLIHYKDPDFRTPDAGKAVEPIEPTPGAVYDFRLLSLTVLFENTAVRSFHSYAQVTLGKLFGMVPSGLEDTENLYRSIVLRGSYQQNGTNYTYSFGTASGNTFLFADSNIVSRIIITSAEMTTRSSSKTSVVSWIGMKGFLDFHELENEGSPFDILSFGSSVKLEDSPTPREGLSFSNLGLLMTYDCGKDETAFDLQISDIRFDLATSMPRPESLFRAFSLELEGMVAGTKEKGPSELGYLPVIADMPLGGVDEGEWYGLRYKLDMGSPGALAGDVGLTSHLLIAWSPESSGSEIEATIGIELPGTGGGSKLISLQNVMKLSIGQIRLVYGPVQDDPSKKGFLLMMTEIALKFLGMLKIPPSGSTLFYLFGNPKSDGKPSGLGWYAMYRKEAK